MNITIVVLLIMVWLSGLGSIYFEQLNREYIDRGAQLRSQYHRMLSEQTQMRLEKGTLLSPIVLDRHARQRFDMVFPNADSTLFLR